MNIEGFGISGIALLFVTLIITSRIALKARRAGHDLDEPKLVLAATIVRMRNWSLFLGMLAISGFLMLLDGITHFQPGTPGYVNVDAWTGFLLFGGITLLAVAVITSIFSTKTEFNFKQLARDAAHRHYVFAERMHTKRELMRRRPKRKFMRRRSKQSNNV